jgi:prevent-host-death family protein
VGFPKNCYIRSMSEAREIPQRELRNNVAGVLREVAEGARVRVTVRGRAVAELVPVSERPWFVPRAEVEKVLAEAPLDHEFAADVDAVVGSTIEEL